MIKQALITMALFGLVTACSSQKNSSNSSNTNSNTTTNNSRPQQGQGGGQRGERPQGGEMFTHMDENGDGKLSQSEVKGPLAEQFSSIDTDGNGYISKTELENAPKPERGQGGPGGGQGGPRR